MHALKWVDACSLRGHEMKNVLLIAVSIFIVWVVWRLLSVFFIGLLGTLFQLALIGLFCYAVYMVYKALNRQKIM